MRFVFRYTDRFVKSAAKIFSEEELRALELYLAANPEAGDVIPGGRGLRKVRFATKKQGKGKRGGARVIYLRIVSDDVIVLADCYVKNEKENLSGTDLKNLENESNE